MAVINIEDFVKVTFTYDKDESVTALDTGVVCLLLQDAKLTPGTYYITNTMQIPTELEDKNKTSIRLALLGRPKKVIAVVQQGSADAVKINVSTLSALEALTFDLLAIPGITEGDMTAVADWAKAANQNAMHRFMIVLPNMVGDDQQIINYAHGSITIEGQVFDISAATPYIAARIAALVPAEGLTYQILPAVEACSPMTNEEVNAATAAGKLVLLWTGRDVRFASDANSFTSANSEAERSAQDIRVVSIMNLFYNSAKLAIMENYISKYSNNYQNKLMLAGALSALLLDFENSALCEKGDTYAKLDLAKQTAYLREISYKTADGRGVDDMSTDEILRARTGKKVWVKVRMLPLSAIGAVEIEVGS